jgi:hypothetical protein
VISRQRADGPPYKPQTVVRKVREPGSMRGGFKLFSPLGKVGRTPCE